MNYPHKRAEMVKMYRLVYKIEIDFIWPYNWIGCFCLNYPHRDFKICYSVDNHLGILSEKTYPQYKRLYIYNIQKDLCTL